MSNCPPCVVIITGEEGLAAIDRYNQSDATPKGDTSLLAGQVEASCELATYLSLLNAIRQREVNPQLYQPIIQFHHHLAEGIEGWTPEQVEQAGERLRQLNIELSQALG